MLMLETAGLHTHPAATIVPAMRPDEWQAFLADVRENGIREPLTVQTPDVILDGRHRWLAAKECAMPKVPARIVDLSSEQQERYVIAAALLRRHLTDDQRAILALKYQRKVSVERQSEAGKKARAVQLGDCVETTQSLKEFRPRTSTEAAKLFGVPEWSLRRAAQLEREAPNLAEQVAAGEIDLREARHQMREERRSERIEAIARNNTPLQPARRYHVVVLPEEGLFELAAVTSEEE